MAEFAAGEFGGIDLLVNNAAIYGHMQVDPLLSVDLDYYNQFMSVNRTARSHCARACHPHMVGAAGALSSTSLPPPRGWTRATTGCQGRHQRPDQ